MQEFLYLFRGGDIARAQESPESMQAHMEKWKTWMGQLGQDGYFIGGQPLQAEGKTINGTEKVITDGPFTEGKEVVGGYLIVKARDLDHAVELSMGCPLYEHNGNVEVREIASM